MKERLRQLWQSRTPRERVVIMVLVVIIVGMLYISLVYSANQARPPLRASVLSLRADAARLEQQADEIQRLRAVPPPAATQTELRTLVQAQAAQAGIAKALVRIDAPDANRVQVVFGAVAFPDWLNWVATLSAQSIRLETCRIEALSKPGLVSATATFVRAAHQ